MLDQVLVQNNFTPYKERIYYLLLHISDPHPYPAFHVHPGAPQKQWQGDPLVLRVVHKSLAFVLTPYS